jgi:spore maturation protein CgeB
MTQPNTPARDLDDDRRTTGLICAAHALSQLGRLESQTDILRQVATSDPTGETLKAWLTSAEHIHDRAGAAAALRALECHAETEDERQRLRDRRMRFLSTRPGRPVRVAGIMDEFTTASFRPECVFLPLLPFSATRQLEQFAPDFVFVESAWHGNDEAWSRQVSTVSDHLRNVLDWCRKNRVPSIFWNKEDPVHFSTFLPAAGLCDHVFTTDMDCIPAYKDALGHDRVYFLPFAAQPQTHNPIATMQRKDAFNFAGSYYLRYPERQRDIAAILDAVKQVRPVEIYDRNHGGDHPHYKFPDEYQSMILGKLPFSEIDKAYKGYRYGINMNTIKQSQTMFARRVYELMASNTVVVSNFSRGVRMTFGDLVICSDKRAQLAASLTALAGDDLRYRKYRLQGLRKVMAEHTYEARLDYILAKVQGRAYRPTSPAIAIFAAPRSRAEADAISTAFARQTHKAKHLFMLAGADAAPACCNDMSVFTDVAALWQAFVDHRHDFAFWGVMHGADHYGASYLTDLALTARYSDAEGFGKACHYTATNGAPALNDEALRYRETDTLPLRAALMRRACLDRPLIERALRSPADICIDGLQLMGIDEFNYCQDGADNDAAQALVDDIDLPFQGLSTADLYATAEGLAPAPMRARPRPPAQPVLRARDFFDGAPMSTSTRLIKRMAGDMLEVVSDQVTEKALYLWLASKLQRSDLGLIDDSVISFQMDHDLDVAQLVCEFYRADSTKIGHSMVGGGTHSLALPAHCTQLRFGLRILGKGAARLGDIAFGAERYLPPAIVGPSDTLVLTKQYPAYDDLYKYGFLHSRVRAYRAAGLGVDIFRLSPTDAGTYREFENVDVASGDAELLDATLATGHYKHVLVHLLNRQMWDVLKKHTNRIKVTVWLHGAEIQAWQRRSYEFVHMSAAEISHQKKLSAGRMRLWDEIFSSPSRNLRFVSVSQNFMDEVEEDVGKAPPSSQVAIIHNFIDGNLFNYVPKAAIQRSKVLSIRPYANRKYANDLSVAAILELSKRPVFAHL